MLYFVLPQEEYLLVPFILKLYDSIVLWVCPFPLPRVHLWCSDVYLMGGSSDKPLEKSSCILGIYVTISTVEFFHQVYGFETFYTEKERRFHLIQDLINITKLSEL